MRVGLLIATILLGAVAGIGQAQAAGHVYLLRGFAGIFSTGLDDLDAKLAKRGIRATIHSYAEYDDLAVEAARLQKSGKGPVIIVGHSLGADSAIAMAEKMKELGARVALVVTFGSDGSFVVPSNVSQAINYYQNGALLHAAPGSRSSVSNISLDSNPDVNHFNIEKLNALHAKVIARIQALTGGSSSAPKSSATTAQGAPSRHGSNDAPKIE